MSIGIIELGGDFIGMGQFHKNMNDAFELLECELTIYTSYDKRYTDKLSRINFKKYWTAHNRFSKLIFFCLQFLRLSLIVVLRKHNLFFLHFFGESGYNKYLVVLLNIFGIKYFVIVHDINSLKNRNKESNFILKNASLLIGLNSHVKEKLIRLYPKIPIKYVRHPKYDEIDVNKQRSDKIRVLFWGHLKKSKGLEVLLDAIALMTSESRSRFLFAVSGQNASYSDYELESIDKQCAELGIALSTSFSTESELHSLLLNTDVVVLPYRKVYQSGALLHSISYRACIVASDIPFFADEIQDGVTGILFENGNSLNLKAALEKLTLSKVEGLSEASYSNYLLKYSVTNLSNDLKQIVYEM